MTTMRQILYPFAADSAERDVLPYSRPLPGQVAYNTGYSVDYQLQLSVDPNAKAIERKLMNGLFYDITNNIQAWQQQCIPDWFQPSGTGPGQWPPYQKNNMVRRNGVNYISLTNDNSDPPGPGNPYWEKVELSSYILGQIPMRFGGSAAATGDFNSLTASQVLSFSANLPGWANRPTDAPGMFECSQISAANQVVQRYTDVSGNVYWRGFSNSGWTPWYTAESTAATSPYLKWNTRNDLPWDWEYSRGWNDYSGSSYVRWALSNSSSGLNSHTTASIQDMGGAGPSATYRGHWTTKNELNDYYLNQKPLYIPFTVDTDEAWNGQITAQLAGYDTNGAEVESVDFYWSRDEKNWYGGPMIGPSDVGTTYGIARSRPFTNPAVVTARLRFAFGNPAGGQIIGAAHMRIGANQEWTYMAAARALMEKVNRSGDTMTGTLNIEVPATNIGVRTKSTGGSYNNWWTLASASRIDCANLATAAINAISTESNGAVQAALSVHIPNNNVLWTFHSTRHASGMSHQLGPGVIKVFGEGSADPAALYSNGDVQGPAFTSGSLIGDLNLIRNNWLKRDGSNDMTGTLTVSKENAIWAPNVGDSGYSSWRSSPSALSIKGTSNQNKIGVLWSSTGPNENGWAAISAFNAAAGNGPQITMHLGGSSAGFSHMFGVGSFTVPNQDGSLQGILSFNGDVAGSAWRGGSILTEMNLVKNEKVAKSGDTMTGTLNSYPGNNSVAWRFGSTGGGFASWATNSTANEIECSNLNDGAIGVARIRQGATQKMALTAYAPDTGPYWAFHSVGYAGAGISHQMGPEFFKVFSKDGNAASLLSNGNIQSIFYADGSLFGEIGKIKNDYLLRNGGNAMVGTISSENTACALWAKSVEGSLQTAWRSAPSALSIKATMADNKVGVIWANGASGPRDQGWAAISADGEGGVANINIHLEGASNVAHLFGPGRFQINNPLNNALFSEMRHDGNVVGGIWSDTRSVATAQPSEINLTMFRDRGTLIGQAQAAGLPTGEIEWTIGQLIKLPSGMYQMIFDPAMAGDTKNSAKWLGMVTNGVQNGTYPYGVLEVKHGTNFSVLMYYPQSVGGETGTQVSVLFNCVYWGDTASPVSSAGTWRRIYNSSNMQFTY